MSGRIGPPAPAAAPVAPSTVHAGAARASRAPHEAREAHGTKRSKDLEVAAREFEQIFVRAMLKGTPIAGKGDTYGDLAVDAMAKSVTAGRGLGLGDLIKRSVEKSERALKGHE